MGPRFRGDDIRVSPHLLGPRRRERNPPALLHAAMAGFGEGDVADAGRKIARQRLAGGDMAQERFPPDAVGVAVAGERRRFAPSVAIIGTDIPHHAEMRDRRGLRARLHLTAMQARDRRAFRAIHLQREQVVAAHARRPRTPNAAEDAAFDFDEGRSRILDCHAIALTMLVNALGRGGPGARGDSDDAADDAFDHVPPVRVHIQDDPAAARAIIPARALAGLLAAVEHPPTEIETESDNASELSASRERGKLLQTGEIDFVLDDAMLEAA